MVENRGGRVHGDGGEGGLVGVDTNGDHSGPFRVPMTTIRDEQPDLKTSHASAEPHRGGCRRDSAGYK